MEPPVAKFCDNTALSEETKSKLISFFLRGPNLSSLECSTGFLPGPGISVSLFSFPCSKVCVSEDTIIKMHVRIGLAKKQTPGPLSVFVNKVTRD